MRRLLILAVVALSLSLAATAAAGKSKYAGDIDPSGEIAFTLKKKNSKVAVLKLRWSALPVNCGGTADTTSGGLSFAVPVVKKAFKARAVLGKPSKPEAKARIDGKLAGKKASGKITLEGSKLPLDSGGSGDCRSGKLDWSAAK